MIYVMVNIIQEKISFLSHHLKSIKLNSLHRISGRTEYGLWMGNALGCRLPSCSYSQTLTFNICWLVISGRSSQHQAQIGHTCWHQAVWLWTSYLTSRRFPFLISKIGTKIPRWKCLNKKIYIKHLTHCLVHSKYSINWDNLLSLSGSAAFVQYVNRPLRQWSWNHRSLDQGFSNFCMYTNHLGILLKTQTEIQEVCCGAWDSVPLTSSQVVPMLLVQGLYFEN